jgi:hypothetical protein
MQCGRGRQNDEVHDEVRPVAKTGWFSPHAMVRATKAARLAYLGQLNDALLPLTVALDLVRRRLDRKILTEGQQR